MISNPGPVTALLAGYRSGDSCAISQLVDVVYPELRRIARRVMNGERGGHTLDPTSLVHEAFFRLFKGEPVPCNSSREFFAAAVRHMRWVLTDYARKDLALKRQGVAPSGAHQGLRPEELVDIDRALEQLSQFEPEAARIVELKYYAGLSIEEIAAVLESSPRSIVRTWEWARVWLYRRLGGAKRS